MASRCAILREPEHRVTVRVFELLENGEASPPPNRFSEPVPRVSSVCGPKRATTITL